MHYYEWYLFWDMVGFIALGLIVTIPAIVVHEYGHYWSAKWFNVSASSPKLLSWRPHVDIHEPGDPIKEGLIYFSDASKYHQNIIVAIGPITGLSVAPLSYWLITVVHNDPTFVNIFGGAEWSINLFHALPFVTLLNFIPIKFKNDQSDGYHLFIKPKR